MHVRDCSLSVEDVLVDEVCSSTIRSDCHWLAYDRGVVDSNLTLWVLGHVEFCYATVVSEDLHDVAFLDILGELLDDNLERVSLEEQASGALGGRSSS